MFIFGFNSTNSCSVEKEGASTWIFLHFMKNFILNSKNSQLLGSSTKGHKKIQKKNTFRWKLRKKGKKKEILEKEMKERGDRRYTEEFKIVL